MKPLSERRVVGKQLIMTASAQEVWLLEHHRDTYDAWRRGEIDLEQGVAVGRHIDTLLWLLELGVPRPVLRWIGRIHDRLFD